MKMVQLNRLKKAPYYVDKSLKCKSRRDLNLNKPKEIESAIIETTETKKTNTVIARTYKGICFWLTDFCDDEIVRNNKNEHLWSSNGQKNVMFLQEV